MAEIKEITPLFLTARGLKLQAKVQTGLTQLNVTRVLIGSGYLDSETGKELLTAPINEISSHTTRDEGTDAQVDVTRLYYDEGNGVAMISVHVESGDNESTHIRELCIMASDPNDGEIMYGYTNLGDEALPLPKYDGRAHAVYDINLPTVIANANDVNITVTKIVEVPVEEFDAHTGNTSNPHHVTQEQVGLGKVPNVATNDQTPTYTEAGTVSELESGEKISTAFGKIAAAIKNLISHLADTGNPHSVTKSQVGLGNVNDTSDMAKPVSTAQRTAINGVSDNLNAHISDKSNPHEVTAADVGLGNVTNESKTTMFTNAALTGKPTAPTAETSANDTQIATTAFVQTAILAKSLIDPTYRSLLSQKDAYDLCTHPDSETISLQQYYDGGGSGSSYNLKIKNRVKYITSPEEMPLPSGAPVFLISVAYLLGDGSEITNAQGLLYPDGLIYGRERCLWDAYNGEEYDNPKFGEWSVVSPRVSKGDFAA